MSKILIEGNKVIIDGHASDLETCNTLTNLCDELSTSDKFRTVRYENGYGEFESVSENDEKKFVSEPGTVTLYIKSNDGSSILYYGEYSDNHITITTTGVSWHSNGADYEYIYTGSKVFLGLSNTPNATVAKYTYGTILSVDVDEYDTRNNFSLYIVEKDLGYQVNLQSNDGATTLAQNATVDSVVVTATGAQLKCGDTVNVTYTYSGSKLFVGLATSANATAPKYKPGDIIPITAETALYIVENIIIPDHHSSLTELFTNIAAVIREKTGDTASIVADDFPSVIRSSLRLSPFEPAGESYLTFSSPNSFTLKVNDTAKHWDGILEYFASDRTWSTWKGTTTLSSTTKGSDNVLYLRGTRNTKITGNRSNYKWVLEGSDISCVGNIENLLDYATVASGAHPTMVNYCYSYMFRDCTSLTTAPALPATTLADYCYSNMFNGCSSLTTAPALPATTLAKSCYSNMFQNCTSLTQVPALPATTLASSCYSNMFNGCSSLTTAPALPATTLADSCYYYMFCDCSSLTTAPALPATTLADSCYYDMFSGCFHLTTAPALPATTLAKSCYTYMFERCSSLTTAPALPATTLADSCYSYMFELCSSLTTAPELPATTVKSHCYGGMFRYCRSLTTAPALPATTLTSSCYLGMFRDCSSLTTAPALPATTLADNCYYYMFYGCSSLYVSDTSGYGYTNAWKIPTTGTASGNYTMNNMFANCRGTRSTNSPNFNGTQKTYYTQNRPVT